MDGDGTEDDEGDLEGRLGFIAMVMVQTCEWSKPPVWSLAKPTPTPPPPTPTPPPTPAPTPVHAITRATARPHPIPPRGITNGGNQCYANALLQCMFATPYFAETALAQKYPANSFGMALSRMFERMFVKSDASIDHMVAYGNDVRKSIVTTSSGQLPFRAQGQEDPSEYLYAFFASDPTIERIMHHFFQLSITEVVTCPNPKQSRTLMTTSNITFQLQIPTGASTLGACLADYFAEEDLEYPTYNESKRSGCSLCKQAVIHRRKHALVNPLPQHLIIFLKRFINPRKKDTRLINYPDSGLDLRAYLQPSDVRTNDGGIYELYAVCLHSSETGSASSGHYTARIRVPKTNEWYLMDDAAPPKPLDYSEARKSHSDAYALFYTRRP